MLKKFGIIAGSCLGLVALWAVLIALGGLFWGWILMLILGAFGLEWGLFPLCFLLGMAFSAIFTRVNQT
jgi:hypothetical protein